MRRYHVRSLPRLRYHGRHRMDARDRARRPFTARPWLLLVGRPADLTCPASCLLCELEAVSTVKELT